MGEMGGVNLHIFVGNSSLSRIDALGLFTLRLTGQNESFGQCGSAYKEWVPELMLGPGEAFDEGFNGSVVQYIKREIKVYDCSGKQIGGTRTSEGGNWGAQEFYESFFVVTTGGVPSFYLPQGGAIKPMGKDIWEWTSDNACCTKGEGYIQGSTAYYNGYSLPWRWPIDNPFNPGKPTWPGVTLPPGLGVLVPTSNVVKPEIKWSWDCCYSPCKESP